MIPFLWNLLIAFAWAVVTGELSPANLIFGFTLGYLILWFSRRFLGYSSYHTKTSQVVRFGLFYLWELILSNLRVAYDVVTPTHHMRPGIVAVPLDARTDAEIALLSNLLTLTPGSLSVEVSEDKSVLYVHLMYIPLRRDSSGESGEQIPDLDEARRQIKERMERRVLEVLR